MSGITHKHRAVSPFQAKIFMVIACAAAILLLLLLFARSAGAASDVVATPPTASSPQTASDSDATGASPSKNFLVWLHESLGWRYDILFLALSISLIALIAINAWSIRRDAILPDVFLQAFEERLQNKQYQEIFETAKNNNSLAAQTLAAGMTKLTVGYEAALEEMLEIGAAENLRLEQRVGHVGLIARLAPLVGLLGTVDGMVMAFREMAKYDALPKSFQLAHGIATALVTTMVGLWIALPAVVAHHCFRNRLARLVMETGIVCEDLMQRFAAAAMPKK